VVSSRARTGPQLNSLALCGENALVRSLPTSGAMKQSIAHVALVVRDYDEAIAFFTNILNFVLLEDTYVPEQDKRWVLVAPRGSTGTSLLLARPSRREQHAFVGNQTGGRITFFLATDDFWRDYRSMVAKGVEFVRAPSEAEYGTVAVFKDLYGNLWDLVEYRCE
jgi:catechol 2,3-dioxygenase-like lactoylglutathione lyase family enzyme